MSSLPELLAKFSLKDPIRREMSVVPRVMNDEQGTVEFVASDETLDCYAEIVRVSGWKFNLFKKNAPFVDSHDYSSITKLLGQVTDWRIEGNQLVETVRYSREPNTLAEWAYKMVRDGFLKAVSVGFVPVKMATKWDTDSSAFISAISDMKLDAPSAAQLRAVYLQQEQIELSQCVIGANPNALAKAYKAGCIDEQAIDKLSALYAASKTVTPPAHPVDGAATSRRAKLAFIAAVQAHV